MKKHVIFMMMFLIAGLFACKQNKKTQDNVEYTQEFIEKAITDHSIPVIVIDDFEAEAPNYVGKEILVSGLVDHVCKHGGKRILLVSDNADLHIDSKERFDDKLEGSKITVLGKVVEFIVDEAYLLQQEEDNIQKHKEGKNNDEQYEHKQQEIAYYRDSMQDAGKDHISYYTFDYINHIVNK